MELRQGLLQSLAGELDRLKAPLQLPRPARVGVPDLATPGIQRPRPGRPKPAPGRTPAPEARPPTPPRIGWAWAGAIPPMPAQLRAMATNRGAVIREGNDRCMAGAEGDNSIVGAEPRRGISGRRGRAAQASS